MGERELDRLCLVQACEIVGGRLGGAGRRQEEREGRRERGGGD